MQKSMLYDLFYRELDARVGFVNQLSRTYIHTVAVVLDCPALLQAVQQHFQTVIQVRAHVLVEYIHRKFEITAYHFVTQRALQKESTLVLLYRLRLAQRTVTVYRNHLVAVRLARYLTAYNYLFHISTLSNQTLRPLSRPVG